MAGTLGVTGVITGGGLVVPDGSIAVVDLDIDGGTDIGAALVDADLMIVDDGAGGTNRKATMSRLATYMGTKIGGGMEFIASSGAISGAASVAFTGFDASKYDHYQFYFQHVVTVNDSVFLFAQASTDGGSNYDSTSGNYHIGTTDIVGFKVSSLIGSDTNEFGLGGVFYLLAPHNTSSYTYGMAVTMTTSTAGSITSHHHSSAHLAAQDTDAIRFIPSSGNIESGEITMFGIVNS